MEAPRHHNHLTAWLRDAHAMEQQSAQLLERQIERLEHYPEMRGRIAAHLDETQRQAEMLESCLARYGESTSAIKDFKGSLMGNAAAIMNATAGDEVIKDALGNATIERFEMACYRALITAANAIGDHETAQVCGEILVEEEAMANWADEQLPMIVQQFLERDAVGQPAKR